MAISKPGEERIFDWYISLCLPDIDSVPEQILEHIELCSLDIQAEKIHPKRSSVTDLYYFLTETERHLCIPGLYLGYQYQYYGG